MTTRTLFAVSLLAALASLAALGLIDAGLRTPQAPLGIVSFELCARQASGCTDIIGSWSPRAQLLAALSLGVDYLFMVAYAAAIWFGLALYAQRLPAGPATTARRVAWAAWVAAVADGVENQALARMLLDPSQVDALAWTATGWALFKFAALGVCLVGFAAVAWRWRGQRRAG